MIPRRHAPWLALTVALLAILGTQRPAEALSYGGWNARTSLDSWYDDNLSRGVAVPTTLLPYGNQDLGLNVGVTVGNVFLLTPDVETWVITSVHGRMGMLYPSLSGAWGSIFSNTVLRLEGGREAYALLGTTGFWGSGIYHAGELGFVQPVWTGASARVQAGAGLYLANTTGASFGMPSVGFGLDQAFLTGTQLGLRYAYQTLFYDQATANPRHQLYLLASQRLASNWEVHANYLGTLDTSVTTGYREGYFGAGVAYDF